MMMVELAERLRKAESVNEVINAVITVVTPALRLKGIAFVFLDEHGSPSLGLTNWCSPASIRFYMTELYKQDPFVARAIATGESVVFADVLEPEQIEALRTQSIPETLEIPVATLASQVIVPLHGVGVPVGVLQLWPELVLSTQGRHRIDRVAILISLRLAELGVTRPVYSAGTPRLTRRQAEIARLAGRGDTNTEVADTLGISVNTVKKSLKIVFDMIGVATRRELSAFLGRGLPHPSEMSLPPGYVAVALDDHLSPSNLRIRRDRRVAKRRPRSRHP